jgi:hypothetical protein
MGIWITDKTKTNKRKERAILHEQKYWWLKEPITAFVKLTEPRVIGDLTEVPLPTRFVFVHLIPPGVPGHIFEIGRAM